MAHAPEPDPFTNTVAGGQFQQSKYKYDTQDTLRIFELLRERTPLSATITAVNNDQYVGDVYIGTTTTILYKDVKIYNCDLRKTYNVGDSVDVNMMRDYTALITPVSGGGDLPLGQYQFMTAQMVSDNQLGFDFVRGHAMT